MRASHPSLPVVLGIAILVAIGLTRAGEIRERAEQGLGEAMPRREAALARGFVLGEDEAIDPVTREDFRRSGLSHLLAVSGQNVALLALLAMPLLAALGIGLRERLIWVLGLIAVYVPLAGAGPSIQRAAVMGAAGLLATLGGRRAPRFHALALAFVVTVAIDPSIAGDVGWQLSFAAVLGILLMAGPLRGAVAGRIGSGGLRGALAEGVAMTIAATLATAPLIAFWFGTFSTTTLVANVLAMPAVAPAMWLGMASAGAAQVPGFPVEALNAVNALLLAYIAQVAAWCGRPTWAQVHVELGAGGLLTAYVLLLAGCLAAAWAARRWRLAVARRHGSHPGGRNPRRYPAGNATVMRGAGVVVALAAAVALALWVSAGSTPRRGDPPASGLRIEVLDVGQGDAILLQPAGAPAVLVDAGPPGSGVLPALAAAGVERLGTVVVTHDQADHAGGIWELLGRIPISRLVYARADRATLDAARTAGARPIRLAAGGVVRSGALRLEAVWPPSVLLEDSPARADPNQLALVLIARRRDFSMLLAADAEAELVPLDPGPLDVLKVAHHGSADAGLGALLERTRPRLAVISAGDDNPYGHPDPTTLATLASHRVRTLRTDRDGDVTISVGNGSFLVEAGNDFD